MRIVVQISTPIIAHPSTGLLNIRQLELTSKVLAGLINGGDEIIVVYSGCIEIGASTLRLSAVPPSICARQAAAAAGQCELTKAFSRMLGQHNHTPGQLLITLKDIQNNSTKSKIASAIKQLITFHSVPLISENIALTGEGGNEDFLGAEVAVCVQADLFVILSDISGIFEHSSSESKPKLIQSITNISDDLLAQAKANPKSNTYAKLMAAKILQPHKINMVITSGHNPESLYDIIAGQQVGTRFAFA